MATFTNQATLTYTGGMAVSNIAVGELTQALTAAKTAVVETYRVGDNVTYAISLVNTGLNALTNLSVTDDLGGYAFGAQTVYPLSYVEGTLLYYVNGVLQATPAVTAGPPLTVTGITVPAGGNAMLVYDTVVTAFAPTTTGSTVTNTATVTGDGVVEPVVATETITATDSTALTILKAISPTVVSSGDRVTYTFTIQNFGNRAVVSTDNATVTDLFDPILTDLAVTFNGTAWAETTNYTYDETTGQFQTVAGQITVPAATFTQDPTTGEWIVTPGVSTLVVTGTI